MDWLSKETEILLNPKMPKKLMENALCRLPRGQEFSGHIWLATSGSTKNYGEAAKFVALSKEAFLSSAKAVNWHLNASSKDVWLNALPSFHVGGLGVYARAFLAKSAIASFDGKWSACDYYDLLIKSKATLASLVPTQLYDLIFHSFKAPKTLRAVVIGGGQLSEELKEKAKMLDWPVLPSYGMTEAASQIATACLEGSASNSSDLKILNHIEVCINKEGFIALRGPSLLSFYCYLSETSASIVDPKSSDGWFVSQDFGKKQGDILVPLGRSQDFIKIGGESVDVGHLNRLLNDIKIRKAFKLDVAIVPVAEERLGHELHLMVAGDSEREVACLLDIFHCMVMPFEKIKAIHYVKELPRSPLGKLLPMTIGCFKEKKDSRDFS